MSIAFLSLLSGLLQGLSFPPFNAFLVPWFFLTPLLLIEDNRTPFSKPWANRFSWGLLSGFTANLLIFFWMWDTFKAAQLGFFTTMGSWISMSVFMGIYPALFFLLYGFLPRNILRPFFAGALWVSLDLLKSHALTGLPWALLAHTQIGFLSLLQIASVAGASGVTFLIICFNTGVAEAIYEWKSQYFLAHLKSVFPCLQYLLIVPVLLLITGWGWRRLHIISKPSPAIKVAILQGNIDQYEKWDAAHEEKIKSQYQELVEKAAVEHPDLIVWPESAVPGWVPNDKAIMDWLIPIIQKSDVPHIVGAVSRRDGKEFNSAFFFGPDGKILDVYDKQHLVPFGEYIPFGGFLKRWIPYLGELGVFQTGNGPRQFIFSGGGNLKNCPVSPNICYEAIFPGLVRKSVGQHTGVIVNLTNDGWYLKTGAPAQHYAANVYRAVENNLTVIRAANTGISAVINGEGRELVRSKLMTTDMLVTMAPFDGGGKTPYRLYGPWFDWLCVAGVGLFLLGKIRNQFSSDSSHL